MTEEEFINFFKVDNTNPKEAVRIPLKINKEDNKIMKKNTTKTNNKSATKTNNKIDNNKAARKPVGTKIKVEGGFELRNDIPMPAVMHRKGIKSPFTKTVEVMKVGQSFDVDSLPKHHYSVQKKLKVKLFTEKLGNGKIRVWRKA